MERLGQLLDIILFETVSILFYYFLLYPTTDLADFTAHQCAAAHSLGMGDLYRVMLFLIFNLSFFF